MRLSLVGAGVVGIVSTIAFAVLHLDRSIPLGVGDLWDALILLATVSGTLLSVGFWSGSRDLTHRGRKVPTSTSGWCMECPRCRLVIRKRMVFCPNCGADTHNVVTTRPLWLAPPETPNSLRL